MDEPILSQEDHDVWSRWMRECSAWSHTRAHRRAVHTAERLVRQMVQACDRPYIAWSGGKDSCVLVHLIRVKMGLDVPVMSLVTDIEPPGTREYLERTAAAWGIEVEIVEPEDSFWAWLQEHAGSLSVLDEVTRGHTMLGGKWDDAIETWRGEQGYTGWFWGLRAEESKGRRANWWRRGAVYQCQDGCWRAQPLVGWTGRDVYAYCAAHDVDLPRLYQACRFHADDPSRLRKAMWLPGGFSQDGEVIWLRTYYPSLYRKLCGLFPDASSWS